MSEIDLEKLKAPFPVEKISWRIGAQTKAKDKAIGLAYIDARDLYERLDDVCGPANWQLRYSHAEHKTCAEIGIKINGEWVWKANGAGDSQVEAEKGAFSDAAKRAGVLWGIGRYLYDMPNIWVDIEGQGNFKKFTKDALSRLNGELIKLSNGVQVNDMPEWSPEQRKEEVGKLVHEIMFVCDSMDKLKKVWQNRGHKTHKNLVRLKDVELATELLHAKETRKTELQ